MGSFTSCLLFAKPESVNPFCLPGWIGAGCVALWRLENIGVVKPSLEYMVVCIRIIASGQNRWLDTLLTLPMCLQKVSPKFWENFPMNRSCVFHVKGIKTLPVTTPGLRSWIPVIEGRGGTLCDSTPGPYPLLQRLLCTGGCKSCLWSQFPKPTVL